MFWVMYKFFGHFHSVILNQSNEYSSFLSLYLMCRSCFCRFKHQTGQAIQCLINSQCLKLIKPKWIKWCLLIGCSVNIFVYISTLHLHYTYTYTINTVSIQALCFYISTKLFKATLSPLKNHHLPPSLHQSFLGQNFLQLNFSVACFVPLALSCYNFATQILHLLFTILGSLDRKRACPW